MNDKDNPIRRDSSIGQLVYPLFYDLKLLQEVSEDISPENEITKFVKNLRSSIEREYPGLQQEVERMKDIRRSLYIEVDQVIEKYGSKEGKFTDLKGQQKYDEIFLEIRKTELIKKQLLRSLPEIKLRALLEKEIAKVKLPDLRKDMTQVLIQEDLDTYNFDWWTDESILVENFIGDISVNPDIVPYSNKRSYRTHRLAVDISRRNFNQGALGLGALALGVPGVTPNIVKSLALPALTPLQQYYLSDYLIGLGMGGSWSPGRQDLDAYVGKELGDKLLPYVKQFIKVGEGGKWEWNGTDDQWQSIIGLFDTIIEQSPEALIKYFEQQPGHLSNLETEQYRRLKPAVERHLKDPKYGKKLQALLDKKQKEYIKEQQEKPVRELDREMRNKKQKPTYSEYDELHGPFDWEHSDSST